MAAAVAVIRYKAYDVLWSLFIALVSLPILMNSNAATTLDDAGDYECQLSSTPLRTHVIRLRIIGKCTSSRFTPSVPSSTLSPTSPSSPMHTLDWKLISSNFRVPLTLANGVGPRSPHSRPNNQYRVLGCRTILKTRLDPLNNSRYIFLYHYSSPF